MQIIVKIIGFFLAIQLLAFLLYGTLAVSILTITSIVEFIKAL